MCNSILHQGIKSYVHTPFFLIKQGKIRYDTRPPILRELWHPMDE